MGKQPGRSWHLTLTRSRVIRFLLTNRYVQPFVHVGTVTLFAWALWTAFTGTQNPGATILGEFGEMNAERKRPRNAGSPGKYEQQGFQYLRSPWTSTSGWYRYPPQFDRIG